MDCDKIKIERLPKDLRIWAEAIIDKNKAAIRGAEATEIKAEIKLETNEQR